jgi:hypothetical protein
VTTLFLPQAQLEEWALSEKADMKDGKLVIANEPVSYPLTQAVHFARLVSGQDDKNLVNKVKTEAQLAELGAEQMADSVLLGDTAYEVVPGYVLQHREAAGPGPGPARPGTTDTNLLADFLLNKL